MAINLGPGLKEPTKERRQRFSWVLAGPRWPLQRTGEAMGACEIRGGARLIGELAAALRRSKPEAAGPITDEDGHLDIAETAFTMGISERELQQLRAARRNQTARVAWGCFVAAWAFLGLWAWQAMGTPWSQERVWAAVQFLPFCAAFFVLAFRSAWQNWQLRTGNLGSASTYLRTAEPFWPSAG
jgi:hypothetical protein